ncbi:MAG: mechanosensitive ion channel family protein [Rhodobacteraceae bacterium]|nr:mechanosensitive ion channel family protein [Paracoccaceae bacterium]
MDEGKEAAGLEAVFGPLVQFLRESDWGEDLSRVGVAAAILAFCLLFRRRLSLGLIAGLRYVAARTETDIDDRIADKLQRPFGFAPTALGVYLAADYLALEGAWAVIAHNASTSLVMLAFFWALARVVEPIGEAARENGTLLSPELATWALKAARLAVWATAVATILEIWGIRVLPIIAGFGLIGVAVALGAQDLFKNLISGVLVLAESRLRVGDWIKVEGVVEGTVEAIGFRSTKVRQFNKAPVYVPNARFADGAVINFGERPHRRISWTVGLEYRATSMQLETIRNRVEAYIVADERFLAPPDASRFVRLSRFSDNSIDLMIYCFTKTRAWGEWLQIKEELLLAVKRIVEEEGAGFAFPSQSLYVETVPSEISAMASAAAKPASKPPAKPRAPRKSKAAAESAGASGEASAAHGGRSRAASPKADI